MKLLEVYYQVVSRDRMQDRINLDFSSRISSLEQGRDYVEKEVASHEHLLKDLDGKMNSLVADVKQIRNALYLMALGIAANVPAVQSLLEQLKILLP